MDWWFRFILVVHLLGVCLLVAAMALQATVAALLHRVGQAGDVRKALELSRAVPRLFAPATVLILASGVGLTAVRVRFDQSWGWAAASFVVVVVLAAWGKAFGKRRHGALARLPPERGERRAPELRQALRDPADLGHAALGAWLVVGILVLMVYRPRPWISIAVLAAALLASLATQAWLGRSRPAGSGREESTGIQQDPS